MESKESKYTTKGLPPPPDVSMTTKPMTGLLVDIYGFEELPTSPAPVTCLWLLHPRTQDRAIMHDFARRAVHSWNQKLKQGQKQARGLVALAFDMPNHGTRMASGLANLAWHEGNETHAMDILGMAKGGAGDMSGLMDQVGGYLGREVDAHVCLGWSQGGHAVWQAWFGEERIDAAVAVVGCPDLAGLLSSRAAASKLDCGEAGFLGSKYFPTDSIATVRKRDPKGILFGTNAIPSLPLSSAEQDRLREILDSRIRGKRLLLCSGVADELVPYAKSEPFIRVLEDAVSGWYADGGVDVDNRVYEGVGHRFAADMVNDAVAFLMQAVAEGPRRSKDAAESRAKM
ncbi:Alpha/Beta hydrolase protein [Trichoderma ceciliae]